MLNVDLACKCLVPSSVSQVNLKPALGKIFRLFNIKTNKSFIFYGSNIDFILNDLFDKLNQQTCSYSDLQADWNNTKNKSLVFQVEELQYYYSEADIKSLLNSWCYYLCGNEYVNLYNPDILNVHSFEEENYKLAIHLERVLEKNEQLLQNLESLKSQSDQSINLEDIILERIKTQPQQMFSDLTRWLTLLNSSLSSQPIKKEQKILRSSVKPIKQSTNKVRKYSSKIMKISNQTADGFNFYRGQNIDTWIKEAIIYLDKSPLFKQELLKEVKKFKKALNKPANKGVQIFKMYCQQISVTQIVEHVQSNRMNVLRSVDAIQHRFPALYLASGLKRFTAKNQEKTAGRLLTSKGITDIPTSF